MIQPGSRFYPLTPHPIRGIIYSGLEDNGLHRREITQMQITTTFEEATTQIETYEADIACYRISNSYDQDMIDSSEETLKIATEQMPAYGEFTIRIKKNAQAVIDAARERIEERLNWIDEANRCIADYQADLAYLEATS